MPLPTGLVVKNGSNILASTSSGIPTPVSPTETATMPSSTRFVALDVTVPPAGMASRALMTRLTSAVSNSPGSTTTGQVPSATSMTSETELPRPMFKTSWIAAGVAQIDLLRLTALPARKGQELAGQRGAALPRRWRSIAAPGSYFSLLISCARYEYCRR